MTPKAHNALKALREAGGRVLGVANIYELCDCRTMTALMNRGLVVEERVQGVDCLMDIAARLTSKGLVVLAEMEASA
jgi:hypothetical protein